MELYSEKEVYSSTNLGGQSLILMLLYVFQISTGPLATTFPLLVHQAKRASFSALVFLCIYNRLEMKVPRNSSFFPSQMLSALS